MPIKLCCVPLLAAVILSGAVSAADESHALPRLKSALGGINSLDYQAAEDFSFTKAIASKDGDRVIRYDPLEEEQRQWTLFSLAGQAPSAEQEQEYQREVLLYRQQQRETIAATEGNPLLQLMDMDSLQLGSMNEAKSEYHFKVNDEKYRPYIDGIITLQSDCDCVVSIQVKNSEGFSPQFMVKIKDYSESYIFTPLAAGSSVISRIDKSIEGSAFLTDLSEDYSEVYSDVVSAVKAKGH